MSCAGTFEYRFADMTPAEKARVPDASLRCTRVKLEDKVAVYSRMVVWPALAESFRRDLVALDAEMARRMAG